MRSPIQGWERISSHSQVSGGHVAALLEGLESGDNLIETDVGVELCLGVSEEHD